MIDTVNQPMSPVKPQVSAVRPQVSSLEPKRQASVKSQKKSVKQQDKESDIGIEGLFAAKFEFESSRQKDSRAKPFSQRDADNINYVNEKLRKSRRIPRKGGLVDTRMAKVVTKSVPATDTRKRDDKHYRKLNVRYGRSNLKQKPSLPDPFHPWRRPPPYLRMYRTFNEGSHTQELYKWLRKPGHGLEFMALSQIKEVKVRRVRKLRQRSASQ